MKIKYFLMILPILLFSTQLKIAAQVNKDQAINIIKSNLNNEELQNYNVLIYPHLIHSQEFYLSPYHVLHSEYDTSWLFFIDMYPLTQWDHICKYIFLDEQTGNYTSINYRIPPQDYWYGWEYINSPYPYPVNNPIDGNNQGDSNIASPDPHKYAVFICWNENEACRWNNLSHIYCGIKRNFGFIDENIFVLSGNGNYDSLLSYNLDNFGDEQDFDGPCTKDSLVDVFTHLSQVMTDEDLLFVYATTHGDTIENNTSLLRLNGQDSIIDFELAALVDDIHCSQKIFGIDACFSGGFVDDLQGNHTIVQTCVRGNIESVISQGLGFHDMTFWWGTALRGYYPYSLEYPYDNGPKIGEHDSLYIFSSIDSTDYNPDDTLGGNNDGFIQFQEVFNFASRYASDIRIRNGQNYIDDGFRGDLLTLNGIEGRVDTSQNVSGSYLIGRKLTIAPNVTLSNNLNANFYLNDSSEIYVSENACFNPYGYWTNILGCSGQSIINVKGSLRSSVMDFSANPGAFLTIHFDNMNNDYDLSYFDFNNCLVSGAAKSLSFDESTFSNSSINFIRGDLVVDDRNEFINSTITLTDPGTHSSSCTIIGNSFENDTTVAEQAVITLEDYCNFLIEDNEIFYDANRGVELFYAGWDASSEHAINDNTIQFTGTPSVSVAELGIHAYYSNVDIHNNKIQYNDYGITGFHRSELTVKGDSLALDIDSTQLIGDNTKSQCLFNISTFPTEFHWNVIRDISMGDKPFIKVVEFDEMIEDTSEVKDWFGDSTFHVEYNCWVNDTNPEDRLVPVGAYIWRPAWCPGSGHLRLQNEPELMYYTALSEIENDNYSVAEYGFKQIIADYPDHKYAQASLKGLFALNPALYDTNFSLLGTYSDSLSNNPADSLLGTTANWISIHCKIKNKQYQQAINALDSVISNAGSLADSVFALIDLNYVYLQTLNNSTLKSGCTIKNESILANTAETYHIKRKDWIELLFKENTAHSDDDIYSLQSEPEHLPVQFRAVYPNPAAKQVNISFEVFKQGTVELSLYSITGLQLLNVNLGDLSLGAYSKSLSLAGFPEGMYLITLSANEAKCDHARVVRTK